MRVGLHPAFVLHQRAYRETSLLVEIFSSERGRLPLIAKGAKRRCSPLRGILQPFYPLVIAWSGRGELGTLTGAELNGSPLLLGGRKLLSGFYLNEVLMRVLPRYDPHPILFQSYHEALHLLSGPGKEEPVLRIFEKRLLDEIGYGLVLDRDVDSNSPIDAEREYYYQCDKGPRLIAPSSVPTIPVRGRTLRALAEEQLEDPELLRESKLLIRFVLEPLLGNRPLHSRRLFIGEG